MLFFYKCLLAGYVFSQVRSFKYRIVASRSTSRLVTCLGLFRLLMKGIFSPYVLWPFDKKLIFWIVTRVSARDYTVVTDLILKQNCCQTWQKNTNTLQSGKSYNYTGSLACAVFRSGKNLHGPSPYESCH